MNKSFQFDDVGDWKEPRKRELQSPWEFSGHSNAVAEEHLKRKTTSVDHKISLQLQTKQEDTARKTTVTTTTATKRRKKKKAIAMEDDEDEDNVSSEDEDSILELEEEVSEDDGSVDNGSGENSKKEDSEEEEEEEEEECSDDDEEEEDGENNQKKALAKQEKLSSNGVAERKNGKSSKVTVDSFFALGEGASFNASSFTELNISRPLIRACEALGYKKPTPIQAACIPLALTGRDICGSAVTGSGKTAAFALPLLERLLFRPRRFPATRVLILTPTRELAVQVHSMIEKLAQFTDIRCCLIVGGLSSKVQEVALRTHPDVVVATPGRMIDHLHNSHSVGLEDLAILVLDEADRLLELGFSQEVHELVRMCPKKRQTMLFSATMTEQVDALVKLSLVNPVRLSADPSTKRPSTLSEEFIKIRPQHEADKEAVLLALCSRSFSNSTILFCGTKVQAHRLKILFGLSGLKAAELHGNMTQSQRLDALELFRKKEVAFLTATDVAARGLDIMNVETVINFECPRDITSYVHRVGRTARAGKQGCAITFVCDSDRSLLKAVAKRAGCKLQNRIVAATAINHWREKIEGMEDDFKQIIQQEKEERALRKAEMEASKAMNLMEHEAEIYSRPKKTWFQTPKEKRQLAKEAKDVKTGIQQKPRSSIEEAAEARKKEKRRAEKEQNMTRRKRRRLEASREVADDESEDGGETEQDDWSFSGKKGASKSQKKGAALVDVGYRRARAVKAAQKSQESGKRPNQRTFSDKKKPREKGRSEEMRELFQGDLSKDKKQGKIDRPYGMRKPGVSRKAFKSKSRYKRR